MGANWTMGVTKGQRQKTGFRFRLMHPVVDGEVRWGLKEGSNGGELLRTFKFLHQKLTYNNMEKEEPSSNIYILEHVDKVLGYCILNRVFQGISLLPQGNPLYI